MWTIAGFLFCSECGARGYRYPAPNLLLECMAVPLIQREHHIRRKLKRMHDGRHPDSNVEIGDARRLFSSAERATGDHTYLGSKRRALSKCNDAAAKNNVLVTYIPMGRSPPPRDP